MNEISQFGKEQEEIKNTGLLLVKSNSNENKKQFLKNCWIAWLIDKTDQIDFD